MLQRATFLIFVIGLLYAGTASAAEALLLYGGEGNHTFLGCLNCRKYDQNSVLNEYGPHGSLYMNESIFNRYSDFGSRYSNNSPCNPYASNPPVVVNGRGNFYGRLSLNQYVPDWLRANGINGWLAGICAGR